MRLNYCSECGVSLTAPVPVNGAGQPSSPHQRWCSAWEPAAAAVPVCAMCHGRKRLTGDTGTVDCPRCEGEGTEPGARAMLRDAAMLEHLSRTAA